MSKTLPSYYGWDSMQEPIDLFFEDMEDYFAIKDIPSVRKMDLLNRAVKFPARREFMENQGAAAPFPIIITPNDQATAPLREANGENNYERAKTWLMNKHFSEEQQEKLRGTITSMVQGSNESPAQFYA